MGTSDKINTTSINITFDGSAKTEPTELWVSKVTGFSSQYQTARYLQVST